MKPIYFALTAALLSGCSIFPTPEPKTQYTLSSPTPLVKAPKILQPALIIKVPTADASLNTAEIAVSPSPGTRTYIEGALWTDRAPVVLQNLLIQGFQNSGVFSNVGTPGTGIAANIILDSQLRDFSVHYEGNTPVIVVDLYMKIFNLKARQIIEGQRFEVKVYAAQNNQLAIRQGFQEAVDQLTTDIIQWLVTKNLAKTS